MSRVKYFSRILLGQKKVKLLACPQARIYINNILYYRRKDLGRKVNCNSDLCTGCHACEIACSYHHFQIFSRKLSSIHVTRQENTGIFNIKINDRNDEKRPICDNCDGEPTPYCVRFCIPKALYVEGE